MRSFSNVDSGTEKKHIPAADKAFLVVKLGKAVGEIIQRLSFEDFVIPSLVNIPMRQA